MLVCTTWKGRPLSPEQGQRMMNVWAKTEAREAESGSSERLCWYLSADGTGGVTVSRVIDEAAATALQLETCLALGEFLELESKVVLDMETAMPSIIAGLEHNSA
jgi:hypothetical protein